MVAELAQEFALAARERFDFAARHDQHAEHAAALLDHQRHDHHGLEPAARQALRKRIADLRDVGFVHQLARHAARQPVLIDLDARAFGHREIERERRAACAHPRHREGAGMMLVVAQGGEIGGQVFLDAAHDHLEDAVEILALGDRVRDPAQQFEPLELRQRPALRHLAHTHFTAQIGVDGFDLRGARGDARFQRLVAGQKLLLGAHAPRGVERAHLHEAQQQVQPDAEHAEVRGHRELARGLVGIQHQRVRQRGAERVPREGRDQPVRAAAPPQRDRHRYPQQRHEGEARPDDAEHHRRRVPRHHLEQCEQADGGRADDGREAQLRRARGRRDPQQEADPER